MKIGIDVDDVLAAFLESFLLFYNTKHNTSYRTQQFRSYQLWETLGGTRADAIVAVHEFYSSPYFASIAPVDGAKDAIDILRQQHELHVVTSRQELVRLRTESWLSTHFPNAFQTCTFTNSYTDKGKEVRKSQVCDQLQLDLMIEDNNAYAIDCVSDKRRVILLDKPWNQGATPQQVIRMSSWKDIEQFIAKEY
jgi:uncharacterized protein